MVDDINIASKLLTCLMNEWIDGGNVATKFDIKYPFTH